MKNILKNHRWLPIFALSALMAAPQLTTPAQAGLFGLSEEDEIAAGKEVAAQAQKEYGPALPANDPMSVRVRTIGQQFANLSTRKSIPYTYQVLANDKVLNAFAAPGGPVFVTRKLVTTTSNDAELAYVLGHETGHIERKHIVKSVEKEQKVGIAAGILGAILGDSKTGSTIGAVASLGWNVISKGYSRDQETEADITGVRWMSQLGYDPQAAYTMLAKLDDGNSSFLDKYLATHPDPQKRQAVVEKLIGDEKLTDVARRMGGPKLWMAGGNGANWNNTANYNPVYNPGAPNYAPNYNQANNQGNGTFNPTAPVYAPNYPNSTQNNTQSNVQNGNLDFGAPLVYANKETKQGTSRVYLGPVMEIAKWAGAKVEVTRDIIKLRRGDYVLTFKENSTNVDLSGRRTSLSIATQRHNDTLYAPLGTLLEGIGGSATYDANTRRIYITLDNQQRGYFQLQ